MEIKSSIKSSDLEKVDPTKESLEDSLKALKFQTTCLQQALDGEFDEIWFNHSKGLFWNKNTFIINVIKNHQEILDRIAQLTIVTEKETLH